ncbi:MAG: hypothetical protein IAE67_10885 [Candidatus Competibacteraceae bacterium]|nr:hypothetical protein [Candidatus Competibacteraceae bacterium]
MKHSISIFLLLLAGHIVWAQPTDSQVKQRLINEGAIEVRFTSDKGTVHTSLNEKWYIRAAESKWKTTEPGIYRWERSDYRYNYQGGNWVYNRAYLASNWFDGIPNPTEAEIFTLINNNLREFLGNEYYSGVGNLPVVSLCADPKWEWHSMNQVSFNVEYEVSTFTGYTELTKEKVVRRLRLYRDTGGGQHNPNEKKYIKNGWLPINTGSASRENEQCKVIDKKQVSDADKKNMPTFQMQDEQRKAQQQLASLGSLQIPTMTTDKQHIAYIHKMMREASRSEIELLLRSMLSSYYFEEGSNIVLNQNGTDFLQNTLQAHEIYKDMFCEFPQVKHEQYGMMELFDRALQSKVRISLNQEGEKWKIGDIDCINSKNSYYEEAKNAGNANCEKGASIKDEKKTDTFNVGDKVTVDWNGQGKNFYQGTVIKTDPYNANRYFIEFETIQSAWIEATFIKKR